MNDDCIDELEKRLEEARLAIAAYKAAGTDRERQRHFVWLQAACDHAAWACEDYWVLTGQHELEADLAELRLMREAYGQFARERLGAL